MKLVNVDRDTFYRFIKNRNLKAGQGDWFHSTKYYDEENNQIAAYYEYSSWGAPTVYKILAEENYETVNLVNTIISKYDI